MQITLSEQIKSGLVPLCSLVLPNSLQPFTRGHWRHPTDLSSSLQRGGRAPSSQQAAWGQLLPGSHGGMQMTVNRTSHGVAQVYVSRLCSRRKQSHNFQFLCSPPRLQPQLEFEGCQRLPLPSGGLPAPTLGKLTSFSQAGMPILSQLLILVNPNM